MTKRWNNKSVEPPSGMYNEEWTSNVLRIVGPVMEHRLITEPAYRERLKRVIEYIETQKPEDFT